MPAGSGLRCRWRYDRGVTDFELAHRYDTVNLYRRGAAAKLELNRPDRMNAWNAQLAHDLLDALTSVREDASVRAVLLTGAGRAFSSGADLKESQSPDEAGPPDLYSVLTQRYHPLILGVREMPKPVVAAVNGAAAGIGLSLALACDLVLAAESAYFLLAFVNIGLVPDGGSSLLVPSRVGFARAAEMAMLGERIAAAPGQGVGPDQPGLAGRGTSGARRGARDPAGRRPHPGPRGYQAAAQQLALPADGRATGVRGQDPAGNGRLG